MEQIEQICVGSLVRSTSSLKDLNGLSIYLAKDTNPTALNILKLILLLYKTNLANKMKLNINATKESIIEDHKVQESIASSLMANPQNYALEILELLVKYYDVDLTNPRISSKSSFFNFAVSMLKIEDKKSPFYHRYDMTDKKLDIIEFVIKYNLATEEDLDDIHTITSRCLENKYGYTDYQLLRIKNIHDYINLIDSIKSKIELEKTSLIQSKEKYEDKLYPNEEIGKIGLGNDDCQYILNKIPNLISKGIIE